MQNRPLPSFPPPPRLTDSSCRRHRRRLNLIFPMPPLSNPSISRACRRHRRSPPSLSEGTSRRSCVLPPPPIAIRFLSLEKIQSNKREEDVSTTSGSNKKQKTSCISSAGGGNLHPGTIPFESEEDFGSSSDSSQGAWSMLSKEVASNVAETVVSLASFDPGNSMFFACTGIIIECSLTTASILTSLSLIKSIDDDSKTFINRKIKVRLPNNLVAMGWLKFYDVKCNIAIVKINAFHVLRATCLDSQQQLKSQSKVVAVGRCFSSGKLKATTGMLIDNPSEAYSEEFAVSTCEITMVHC